VTTIRGLRRPDEKQRLAVFDGFTVLGQNPLHDPRSLGFDFAKDFHRFKNANHGGRSHVTADLNKRRRIGIGPRIKRPDHGRANLLEIDSDDFPFDKDFGDRR